MKKLITIIIVLLILVVIFFIAAALLPPTYHVQRDIVINVPVDSVFNCLIDLTQRSQWDPWLEKEPDAKNDVSGSMQGIGAVWIWDGKKIGSGKLEIIDAEENRFIQNRIQFESPQSAEAMITWRMKTAGEGTKVSWIITGTSPFPAGRFMGLMMDYFLGQDFEKGLSNLKAYLEKNPLQDL